MKKKENLLPLIIVAGVLVVGIGIAYAALSTTLTITFGNVTQTALNWNVGFQGTTISGTPGGTSSTGRSCGTATVAQDTLSVTVADTTLSKPNDSCTYTLTVKNSGNIPAKLDNITPTAPSGITCGTISGGNMVCGNITYKLASNSDGSTILPTNTTLAASETQTVYLVVKYTGTTTNSSSVTHTGATFTLNYIQD